ncbi:hypothetical protein Fmac_026562 [Flemingia macrophylla]|uniref:Sugar phosphate transporter domain-containing protein n=1 Tax=Flemingia macrophylla TaxID=520843 RepID=A0ABD1LF69_9FABA
MKLNGVSSSSSSFSFARRSWTLSPSSSFKFRLLPPCATENATPDSVPTKNTLFKTLELGALFNLWYLFNIYNKQVLKAYHFPVTVTLAQFTVGTVIVSLMWGLNLYKRPKVSGAMLQAIFPVAEVHTLGNLFTNMSLGKVAVSFTHTIKAMEPFFSVVLSAMFLGEVPPATALPPGSVTMNEAAETPFKDIDDGKGTTKFLLDKIAEKESEA